MKSLQENLHLFLLVLLLEEFYITLELLVYSSVVFVTTFKALKFSNKMETFSTLA